MGGSSHTPDQDAARPDRGAPIATYTCSNFGISVNAICEHCDEALFDDSLTKDDGSTVQISECPNAHGKIKSPLCSGADMSCAV